MTEAQIQDIYTRLDSLTVEINSLKTQIGVVGTTQYAVVQILDRLERLETTTNNNFNQITNRFDRQDERFNSAESRMERVENAQVQHSFQLDNLQVNVNEILRILRDRNGGSGL
jgi:chromosome segregation ATPase